MHHEDRTLPRDRVEMPAIEALPVEVDRVEAPGKQWLPRIGQLLVGLTQPRDNSSMDWQPDQWRPSGLSLPWNPT